MLVISGRLCASHALPESVINSSSMEGNAMSTKSEMSGWAGKATLAGAAVGSAAIAAALLYVARRKEAARRPMASPHPENVPETD